MKQICDSLTFLHLHPLKNRHIINRTPTVRKGRAAKDADVLSVLLRLVLFQLRFNQICFVGRKVKNNAAEASKLSVFLAITLSLYFIPSLVVSSLSLFQISPPCPEASTEVFI